MGDFKFYVLAFAGVLYASFILQIWFGVYKDSFTRDKIIATIFTVAMFLMLLG